MYDYLTTIISTIACKTNNKVQTLLRAYFSLFLSTASTSPPTQSPFIIIYQKLTTRLHYTTPHSNPKDKSRVVLLIIFFRSQDQFLILWMWASRKISGTARSLLKYLYYLFCNCHSLKNQSTKRRTTFHLDIYGVCSDLSSEAIIKYHQGDHKTVLTLTLTNFSWGRRVAYNNSV